MIAAAGPDAGNSHANLPAFEANGVFDAQTARRFERAILEQGGGRDAMEAFVEFRGRPPDIEPLLRQMGLAA